MTITIMTMTESPVILANMVVSITTILRRMITEIAFVTELVKILAIAVTILLQHAAAILNRKRHGFESQRYIE